MTPKKVRDQWRREFVQDAAVTERLCEDLDALEADLAQKKSCIAAQAKTCAEQAKRIEELEQLKEPMGDKSPDQQARAWSMVWATLEQLGIYSFVPKDCDGTGSQRAVEFIKSLAHQADKWKGLLVRWLEEMSWTTSYPAVVNRTWHTLRTLHRETEQALRQGEGETQERSK